MAKKSAGILVFRMRDGDVEVLLGHMGGPFWAKRDTAAWSIPKGEYDSDEDPEAAARREFTEELGLPVPDGRLVPLGSIRQAGGKSVDAWAVKGDLDPADAVSNTFTLEWPPRSGKLAEFPELDRLEWLDLVTAADKIVKGQRAFLDRLTELLKTDRQP